MVPTARSKRPETDEKGNRSEPGSVGANEKDRRSDKQRSSRSRRGATVLHTRGPPRVVRMSRVLSIPEPGIKSSNPFLLQPYRKRLKRCVGCMSEFLHDPPAFVVSKREWHTYFYAGRRCLSCLKMFYHYTEHRASFIVIWTLTLLKLSSISNSRTIVTLVYACRYLLCVCMCMRACGIKETFVHLKCVFYFIFFEFYTPMHVPINR